MSDPASSNEPPTDPPHQDETLTDRAATLWNQIADEFSRVPNNHSMRYGEYVLDMLVADAWVFIYGAGMTVHTFFPMVGESCEGRLASYLNERAAR